MKNKRLLFISGIVSLGLVGCASIPPVDELSQLNGDQFRQQVVGNTWTVKHNWGTWTEYHTQDGMGYGRASGSWGKEYATSSYTVSEDGEACWSYTGEAEWANPELQYCGVVLTDIQGNTYYKSTVDERKPEHVGTIRKLMLTPGDEHGLAAQ